MSSEWAETTSTIKPMGFTVFLFFFLFSFLSEGLFMLPCFSIISFFNIFRFFITRFYLCVNHTSKNKPQQPQKEIIGNRVAPGRLRSAPRQRMHS